MVVLQVLGIIYGIGCLCIVSFFMIGTAHLLSESVSKTLWRMPLILTYMIFYAIGWPILAPEMIRNDKDFREILIETGRIALAVGPLFCVFAMMIYPLVWLWYILTFAGWMLLDNYHDKQKRLAQPRK